MEQPIKRKRGRPRKYPVPTPEGVTKEVVARVEPETQKPAKGKLPYWKRRSKILKDRGTTPRDLYGRDTNPFEVMGPPETMKNVHFFWNSDIMHQKNLPLPGFNKGMYEAVTPDLMEELGITVRTKDRTPDGVPKVGQDAWLTCCPMDMWKDQEKIQRGKPLKDILEDEQKESESKMARDGEMTKPIGGQDVSRDIHEINQTEAEHSNVGGPIN
jgi:hypothetical protein